MRKLIHDVAEIIKDLKTLHFLLEDDVRTTLMLEQGGKYVLRVKIIKDAHLEVTDLCLELFQGLRSDKIAMTLIQNAIIADSSFLTVEFREL